MTRLFVLLLVFSACDVAFVPEPVPSPRAEIASEAPTALPAEVVISISSDWHVRPNVLQGHRPFVEALAGLLASPTHRRAVGMIAVAGDFGTGFSGWTTGIQMTRDEIASFTKRAYVLAGNHDAGQGNHVVFESVFDEVFSRADKPFAMTTDAAGRCASWECYEVRPHERMVMLFVSDRNDVAFPIGFDGAPPGSSGLPSGAITEGTLSWIEERGGHHRLLGRFVVLVTHQAAPRTVIGSGRLDGAPFHNGTEEGAGSIWHILQAGGTVSSGGTELECLPVDLWLSGHTHVKTAETHNGRGITFEEACGTLSEPRTVFHSKTGQLSQHVYHAKNAQPHETWSLILTANDAEIRLEYFHHGGSPLWPDNSVYRTEVF